VDPVRVHCVLDVRGGPSRRVGPGGVLIGRQSDCDIVAADPSVSRRHALVRLTGSGAEVVPLGRSPVDVNGAPTDRPRSLVDGDELRLPGLTLTVAITIPRPEAAARAAFALERSERGGGDPDGSAGGAGGRAPRGSDREPVLDLELRLGEATGAALAMPLIDAALAILRDMATFAAAGVSDRGA
jgi:hypothetical protein